MRVVTVALVAGHATAGALWLGAMAYSLFVVQPRLARMVDGPDAVEAAHRELAANNRWPVVGMLGVLWATGIGLVAVGYAGAGAGWWGGVAVKAALLAAASGMFWWVSWRAWPRRVFATRGELPDLRRRFRQVAVTMLGLVGAAFVLGVVLGSG